MKKKEILFVRHAKSSWNNPRLSDFQRPLNSRGESDAPLMGLALKEKFSAVNAVLSSTAVRARQTAEALCREMGVPSENIRFHEALYLPSREDFLQTLGELESSADRIIVVSHNPGSTDIVNWLCDEEFADMPTCGMVCVEFEEGSLESLDAGTCKALWSDWPKRHK